MRGYFEHDALFAPGELLPDNERRAEHVGPEIVIAKAPLVAKPVEHLDAALQEGAGEAAHPHGGVVFYARPPVHAHGPAALVVAVEDVACLVHAHPFAAIIEAVEGAAGVVFVPIVVEPAKGEAVGAEDAAGNEAYFEGVLDGIGLGEPHTLLGLGGEGAAPKQKGNEDDFMEGCGH